MARMFVIGMFQEREDRHTEDTNLPEWTYFYGTVGNCEGNVLNFLLSWLVLVYPGIFSWMDAVTLPTAKGGVFSGLN